MVKNQPVEVIQGGYSDIRLWPCYMIFSSSMLFLMPQIGFFSSLLLVGTPAFLIAKWVADRQPVVTYDVEAWSKDLDIAIAKELPMPELCNYKIIQYKKQPRLKLEKEVQHKSPQLKVATAKN